MIIWKKDWCRSDDVMSTYRRLSRVFISDTKTIFQTFNFTNKSRFPKNFRSVTIIHRILYHWKAKNLLFYVKWVILVDLKVPKNENVPYWRDFWLWILTSYIHIYNGRFWSRRAITKIVEGSVEFLTGILIQKRRREFYHIKQRINVSDRHFTGFAHKG